MGMIKQLWAIGALAVLMTIGSAEPSHALGAHYTSSGCAYSSISYSHCNSTSSSGFGLFSGGRQLSTSYVGYPSRYSAYSNRYALGGGGGAGGMGGLSTGGNTLGNLLCGVVAWFQGTVGAGIATLGIIVLGLGALMGKTSWGAAIITGLGVGTIFGANQIVAQLGGMGCF